MDSFGELYRRHYAALVGVAYCQLADRHLAEDAAQEAFAIACRELDGLRRADRFASWLRGICRNVAKGIHRTRSRRILQEEAPGLTGESSEDAADEIVRRSVRQLPDSVREVVVLHYFGGLSHRQIAAELGVSPQAVHGRLVRARRKMADCLRRNGLGRRKS